LELVGLGMQGVISKKWARVLLMMLISAERLDGVLWDI